MNKKTIVTFASLFLTTTTYANVAYELKSLNERVSQLEENRGSNVGLSPSTRPENRNGNGVFFTIEGLYWQATQKGMTYAIKGSNSSPVINNDIHSKSKKPEFDWTAGFRVGLGYNTRHGGWDLYASYTRFRFSTKTSESITDYNPLFLGPEFISPFWIAKVFPLNLPGILQSAKANWKVNLNLLDLELGREFFVSKWLTLRPFVGLRSAWIDQDYILRFYRQTPEISGTPTIPASTSVWKLDMDNDFWGLGLRAGLNTKWILGAGWSVYGNGALSILDGHFHNRYKEIGQVVVGGFPSNDSFIDRNKLHTDVAIADLALGFRWEKSVDKERILIAFWAGYEQHIFFEQNQFMNYQYDFTPVIPDNPSVEGPSYFTNGGSLTTHGAVFGFEFGF